MKTGYRVILATGQEIEVSGLDMLRNYTQADLIAPDSPLYDNTTGKMFPAKEHPFLQDYFRQIVFDQFDMSLEERDEDEPERTTPQKISFDFSVDGFDFSEDGETLCPNCATPCAEGNTCFACGRVC
jgi:hypothetical protein